MRIDKSRYLLLAAAAFASVGVYIVSEWRCRRRALTFKREHATDLKTWENEGGNVAPDPAASPQP
jgi:hypothetical protein